jgi:hypothetical protein
MQVEGQHGLSLLRPMATGARVSNAYPTCLILLDSLLKGRLIQDVIMSKHFRMIKGLPVYDGDAFH